jgi:hypothetical protein
LKKTQKTIYDILYYKTGGGMNKLMVLVITIIVSLNFAYCAEYSLSTKGNTSQMPLFIEGMKNGSCIETGTGFEVNYSTGAFEYRFIVTAKHVIENCDAIRLSVNRNLNDKDYRLGKSRIFQLICPLMYKDKPLWQAARENVDLGVILFEKDSKEFLQNPIVAADEYSKNNQQGNSEQVFLDNVSIPIPESIEINVPDQELADIYYAGYPMGIRSTDWIRPFTRRCTIAINNCCGLAFANPNSFLIDYPPFEGESGAPVFIRKIIFTDDGKINRLETKLIGVIRGYVSWEQISKAAITTRDIELTTEIKKKNILGLGEVVPARYIITAIDDYLSR